MKVLMVSPFLPLRDGIGKYAAGEVTSLRAEGHDVEVLAPMSCAAHYVERFKDSPLGLLRLRRYARRADRVILQYTPEHYHRRGSGLSRVRSNVAMALAFRSIRNLTVVCHEVDYPPRDWPSWRPERVFERMAWRGARNVVFHTQREVDEMHERVGALPRNVVIRPASQFVRAAVDEDRASARAKLQLDPGVPVFLCIGFIQPHKGFDRAVRAFQRIDADAKLVVVGSIRVEVREHRAHLNELVQLAASDSRIEVREGAVSDEEFDRWIIASDVVVLPYREIWSSGVVERARVLDRRVIATAVGGLAEQITPEDRLVNDDDELAEAMAAMIGAPPPRPPVPMPVAQAVDFVQAEADRLRGATVDVADADEALRRLRAARGVRPLIFRSRRRVIGRVLDLVKRVVRRGLGWLFVPMLEQINDFEDQAYEAVRAVLEELRSQVQTIEEPPAEAAIDEGVIDVYGSWLKLDPNDSLYLGSHLYEPYETKLLMGLIRPGDVVVDVGAMIGYYSVIFAKLAGEHGRIYCFEPEPQNFELLVANVQRNGYEHVSCVRAAVAEKRSKACLFLNLANRGDHRVFAGAEAERRPSIEVEVTTLDEEIDGPVDLVKIDAQGCEALVFAGMREIVARSPQLTIVMEFCPYLLLQAGTEPATFLADLRAAGFALFEVNEDEARVAPVDSTELLGRLSPRFRHGREDYTNVICVKRPADAVSS